MLGICILGISVSSFYGSFFLFPSVSLPSNFLSNGLGVLSRGQINVLTQRICKSLSPLLCDFKKFLLYLCHRLLPGSQGQTALNMGLI